MQLAAQTKDRLRRSKIRMGAEDGSAIIEFAFVAPIFFLLLFAIVEIGVIFFAQSVLQHATNDLGRMVRTGQIQGQNLTQAQVRQIVCNDVSPLIPCNSTLDVDIEAFSNFGGVQFSPPLDQNGNLNNLNNFQPGNACQVVLVRVLYPWTVFTPGLTPFLSNMAGDKHLLYSAAAFRNEPYNTGVGGGC